MNKGMYDKFSKMDILQLKEEYYKCDDDDKVSKKIIKSFIKSKNKENKANDISASSLNKIINLKKKSDMEKKELQDKERILNKRGAMEKYWHSPADDKMGIDPRFKTELEMDHTNNKLMERLNCELDFRTDDVKLKDIQKPYFDGGGGNYADASFEKTSISPTSFSSKRLLRQ